MGAFLTNPVFAREAGSWPNAPCQDVDGQRPPQHVLGVRWMSVHSEAVNTAQYGDFGVLKPLTLLEIVDPRPIYEVDFFASILLKVFEFFNRKADCSLSHSRRRTAAAIKSRQ